MHHSQFYKKKNTGKCTSLYMRSLSENKNTANGEIMLHSLINVVFLMFDLISLKYTNKLEGNEVFLKLTLSDVMDAF
jgi:hypothetical protein